MNELDRLSEELNRNVENGHSIEELLPLSEELDKLIAEYMKRWDIDTCASTHM